MPDERNQHSTQELVETVRVALDGGVPLLYAEDRKARRDAAEAALDSLEEQLEGERRTRHTILRREREKQSRLTKLEEHVETMRRALDAAGKHLEDCCRTDIGWREQMVSHDAAVRAVGAAERVTNPAMCVDCGHHAHTPGYCACSCGVPAKVSEPGTANRDMGNPKPASGVGHRPISAPGSETSGVVNGDGSGESLPPVVEVGEQPLRTSSPVSSSERGVERGPPAHSGSAPESSPASSPRFDTSLDPILPSDLASPAKRSD